MKLNTRSASACVDGIHIVAGVNLTAMTALTVAIKPMDVRWGLRGLPSWHMYTIINLNIFWVVIFF